MEQNCFDRGVSAMWTDTSAADLFIGLPLIAFLCATLTAPLALALYQRRVEALMQARARTPEPLGPQMPALPLRVRAKTQPTALIATAAAQGVALRQALIAAVAAFAVPVSLIFLLSPDEAGTVIPDQSLAEWVASAVVYSVFIGSLCIPIVLLGVSSRRFTTVFWTVFAPLYLLTSGLGIGLDETTPAIEKAEDFSAAVLVLLTLYAGIGGRRLRNVVPMLTFLVIAMGLAITVLGSVSYVVDACLASDTFGYALGALAIVVLGFVAFWRAALALLERLARAYNRKAFSATQFQIGMWSAIIAILFMLGAGPDQEALLNWWATVVVVAFGLALWVYRVRTRRLRPSQPPLRLLVLRVFASDRRGQRLLDEVAFHWRFLGPIFLVGGPDLAKANLDPHELFAFLRRRLEEMFIRDRSALARHLAMVDEDPDPDTRYRVNEFFCTDDTWRATVEALVDGMHAILLDLRAFDASRAGTRFELELLARRGLLARTVVLTDSQTDMKAVQAAIGTGDTGAANAITLIDAESKRTPDQLLRSLLDCAA